MELLDAFLHNTHNCLFKCVEFRCILILGKCFRTGCLNEIYELIFRWVLQFKWEFLWLLTLCIKTLEHVVLLESCRWQTDLIGSVEVQEVVCSWSHLVLDIGVNSVSLHNLIEWAQRLVRNCFKQAAGFHLWMIGSHDFSREIRLTRSSMARCEHAWRAPFALGASASRPHTVRDIQGLFI